MSKKEIIVPVGTPVLKKTWSNRDKPFIYIEGKILFNFDCSLDAAINDLKDAKALYGTQYKDLSIREVQKEFSNNGYDYYVLYGKRLETDVEYNFRIENEEKKEEHERAEYERLLKKFANIPVKET